MKKRYIVIVFLTSGEILLQLLRNMLLFQYLVYVLEGDFLPRNRVYKGGLLVSSFIVLKLTIEYKLCSLAYNVSSLSCRKLELGPSEGVIAEYVFGVLDLDS